MQKFPINFVIRHLSRQDYRFFFHQALEKDFFGCKFVDIVQNVVRTFLNRLETLFCYTFKYDT